MKLLNVSLAGTLLLGASVSHAALVDLTTFVPRGTVSLSPNEAVLSQITLVGSVFPTNTNIYSLAVQNITSFEYTFSDFNSRAYFVISPGTALDLSPTASFSTYTFDSPYSGFLGFQVVGLGTLFPPPSLGTLTVRNLSDSSLVSAVPEPETYAMLLAGLGLMGTLARRRKKSS